MLMIVNAEMNSNGNSKENHPRSAGLDRTDEHCETTPIANGARSVL